VREDRSSGGHHRRPPATPCVIGSIDSDYTTDTPLLLTVRPSLLPVHQPPQLLCQPASFRLR
jgi:hypothetical protein